MRHRLIKIDQINEAYERMLKSDRTSATALTLSRKQRKLVTDDGSWKERRP